MCIRDRSPPASRTFTFLSLSPVFPGLCLPQHRPQLLLSLIHICYSILYEYGIFKQKIVDGWQQERADNWLPGGHVWLKSHPDQAVEVRFDGEIHENWDHGFHYIQHTNYNSVMAIPSDMYVQGYDGKGVAKLQMCIRDRPPAATPASRQTHRA